MRILVTSFTLLFFEMSSVVNTAAGDFLTWPRSECNSVIKRHTKASQTSFAKAIGKAMLGRGQAVFGLWLSDKSAKAVGRIIQLEERQTDDRALEVHRALRSSSATSYTVVIFTGFVRISPLSGAVVVGSPAPERLAKIFLEEPETKTRFLRASSLEGSFRR